MTIKKIIGSTAALATVFFMSGCTKTPKVKTKFEKYNYKVSTQSNNPLQFRYQPVIGTKQDDTKVMIDMGQWAKIWIKNYKNKNQTFVASHSIVTKVREPEFIAGEQIPRSRRDATYNTYGSNSFAFRSTDLNYGSSADGSYGKSDQEIKEYVNNYEYSKHTERLAPQKREDVVKYDKAIADYIANKKAEIAEKKKLKKEKVIVTQTAQKEEVIKSDAQYESEDEYKNGGLK